MDTTRSESSGREQRLQELLVACVEAEETGQALDLQDLLTRYPEFAAELAEFFADRERIERLAEPLRALAPPPPRGVGGAAAATLGPDERPGAPVRGTIVRYFG